MAWLCCAIVGESVGSEVRLCIRLPSAAPSLRSREHPGRKIRSCRDAHSHTVNTHSQKTALYDANAKIPHSFLFLYVSFTSFREVCVLCCGPWQAAVSSGAGPQAALQTLTRLLAQREKAEERFTNMESRLRWSNVRVGVIASRSDGSATIRVDTRNDGQAAGVLGRCCDPCLSGVLRGTVVWRS